MKDFFDFASSNPGTTFTVLIGALWLVCNLLYRIAYRVLCSINIWLRGWPPPYTDSSGDYQKAEVVEEEP